ncbi:polysaccharide deacetylase family protein [Siminovitchia fortis]|uniref:Polysaccharide deacetylase family sporulation protein PdaB n=1 Tax=Siminovitchia fortis TaxID=254758 RepID=A0A443J0K8_9BACI|nr:polysaccharide deacetylase family protein [Siminovitchia fortis]RWR13969.1 polysaccharide deacetylase family sporulation protein PdaB [Siminovitchia fortis]WHY81182.1 polysaccharide deacetylase family protein [Siminovitchia fortis]
MNFFVTVSGRRIKQGILIVIISFFTALFYFSQSIVQFPVLSAKDEPKAIYKGEKGVALTFNIGWGDVQAEPILKILEEKKIRSATFFLSGAWAERHPEVVEKIKEMGFEIGSLGYAYEDYTELEDEQVRRDIDRSLEVFKKLDIQEVELLRSPTGHFDKRTLKIADDMGLTVIHWSLNSQDWKNPGVKAIVKNVSKVKKGDIILMHASDAATQTAKALPEVLAIIKNKDEMVTVSYMISNGKVKTTLIP